jgi:NAD(P)-dependent dehydrogenase (short-subunit alcohol dehydrogenase family)
MWRNMMQPYGASKAANEALLAALAQELEGTGVTANVLVPGGAVDTRIAPLRLAPDRSILIPAEVMIPPLLWLCSNASDGVNGQRFIGIKWDKNLPPAEAAKQSGAPAAWQQLGRQAVLPETMR